VVFGGPEVAGGGTFELADLDGTNGVKFYGANDLDGAGGSVTSLGDVNGDGLDDIGIGAPHATPGKVPGTGAVYVVFGRHDFSETPIIELATLSAPDGYALAGIDTGEWLGYWVGGGDFDHDGMMDVGTGGWYGNPGGVEHAGRGYAWTGGPKAAGEVVSMAGLDASNGFTLSGDEEEQRLGFIGAGVGDFNHDGIDDLLIGQGRGYAYVVYGKDGRRADAEMVTADVTGETGVKLLILAESVQLHWAAALGDVNFDGRDDLLVVANSEFVFFGLDGSESPSLIDANDFTGNRVGFRFESQFGAAGGGGDINDDGVNDLVSGYIKWPSGAPDWEQVGRAYVVFGRRPYVVGDSDDDGVLSLIDYTAFGACATGPGGEGVSAEAPLYTGECQRMDFNLDGDVDLLDFQRFQWAYTRYNTPPAP
jgi:hypothetical protein